MSRKMKIMHISLNPYILKGGLTYYVDRLINEQLKNGYSVVYLYNGRRTKFLYSKLRRKVIADKGNLIECELVNLPNRVPTQRGRPCREIEHPAINSTFKKVLLSEKPDLIHIHELQGLSASVIDIAKMYGTPVIYTFHGYWPLCSEVALFDYAGEKCADYENGHKCVLCNWAPHSYYLKMDLETIFGPLFRIFRKFRRRHKIDISSNRQSGKKSSLPDIAAQYSHRRKRFIDTLNKCDRLIAISERVRDIYSSYGVRRDLFDVIKNPLCLSEKTVMDLANLRKKDRLIQEAVVNFSYRGGITKVKGVHILIEAFKRLDQTKAALFIYGPGSGDYLDSLKMNAPANVHFNGSYNPDQLATILEKTDVGVIPSLWEEPGILVGIEFLAAGIPVIASRIGWLPEHIFDGKNGFLFEPGNVEELAMLMQKVIDDESVLQKLKRNIDPEIKTVGRLFSEMDEVYRSIIK